MAVLQAARAYTLGLALESSLSWGLNRSIFYAAAKRGFKGGGTFTGGPGKPREAPEVYYLGDEIAYKEKKGKLLFTIGGEVQTELEFNKQIKSRFQGTFDEAWQEALDYVQHFPRETLLSGTAFFSDVYRPKRDELAESWSEMSSGKREKESGRNRSA
jgi:hypothetical protein